MIDESLQSMVAAAVEQGRRRAQILGRGRVTKIETVDGVYAYTVQTGIGERVMNMLVAGVAVGDLVVFVDQPNPVGIGKPVGP